MPATVLIVEDEWLIAEDHAAVLRDADHRIVGPCPSVHEALAAIEETSIDAALLDIELRGERSFPVAQRLRSLNIPFVFLSGYGTCELPPDMIGQTVLAKPVEREAMLAAVARMCRAD